jgi:hypothetical protein
MDSQALDKIAQDAEANAIWLRLRETFDGTGDVQVEGKKTSVHVTAGRAFLGVHPRKNALLITVVTELPLDSPRVRKAEQVSANRVHNDILLTSPGDVDDELRSWIASAYRLASGSGTRK